MSRDLYFGTEVESTLENAARGYDHQQLLRAKYRHAVFGLRLNPQQALAQTLSITAAGALAPEQIPALPDQVVLHDEEYYASPEHALLAMAEYSGLGYTTLPAFRAAWKRGVEDKEGPRPFYRACALAEKLYDSIDADLLPKAQPISL